MGWLGKMRSLRQPVTDCEKPPTLTFISHPPDQNPEEPRSLLIQRTLTELQLHQQAAALQTRTPARKMEGEVERFRLNPLASLRVILPRRQVGAPGRKVATNQIYGRSECLNLGHAPHTFSSVHPEFSS